MRSAADRVAGYYSNPDPVRTGFDETCFDQTSLGVREKFALLTIIDKCWGSVIGVAE
jgi:hypothetical protein